MLYPPFGISQFQTPRVRAVGIAGNTPTLVAANSANRILLGLISPSGNNFFLPGSNINIVSGIPMSTAMPYIFITWQNHGPLVNSEWWGFSTVATNVTVIEIFYNPNEEVKS
jgi:hypothetical protein